MEIEITGLSGAAVGAADFIAKVAPQLASKALFTYGLLALLEWLILGWYLNARRGDFDSLIRKKDYDSSNVITIAIALSLAGMAIFLTLHFFSVLMWPDLYVAEKVADMLRISVTK